MPRPLRPIEDGLIYHIIDRGNNRQDVFHQESDFRAFRRRNWERKVHQPIGEQTLAANRRSSATGLPYGDEPWVDRLAKTLRFDLTIRPRKAE